MPYDVVPEYYWQVLKEALKQMSTKEIKERAGEVLEAWWREVEEESIINDSPPEFRELLHPLGNWREEILNYFDYRITNGFVEGKNNCIKTIKRMAYGYTITWTTSE